MSKTRFGISICAIVRNEGPYILEWMAFHRCVGVEHFFIYDNESTDETSEILEALHDAGLVTRVPWSNEAAARIDPNVGPQLPAYMDFLRFRGLTEWVAIIDADEFIVPVGDGSIPAFLSRFPNIAAVGLNWRVFGSSGETHQRNEPVIQRFLRRATDDFHVNKHIKSITRTAALIDSGIHISSVGNCVIRDSDGELVDPGCAGIHSRVSSGRAQVNHYVIKSVEEWNTKKARGRAGWGPTDSQKFRDEQMFHHHDRNEIVDASALRWLSQTWGELRTLSRFVPNPLFSERHLAWGRKGHSQSEPGSSEIDRVRADAD